MPWSSNAHRKVLKEIAGAEKFPLHLLRATRVFDLELLWHFSSTLFKKANLPCNFDLQTESKSSCHPETQCRDNLTWDISRLFTCSAVLLLTKLSPTIFSAWHYQDLQDWWWSTRKIIAYHHLNFCGRQTAAVDKAFKFSARHFGPTNFSMNQQH